jgi:hypothetical protein
MNSRILVVGAAMLAWPLVGNAQVRARASADAEVGAEVRGTRTLEAKGAGRSTAAASAGDSRGAEGQAGGEAALAATVAAGLPEAPVRRVIAEGRARGASEAQVDRAAMAVHTRLRASMQALATSGEGTAASATEIEAGAEALASGARPRDLRRLADAAPADRSLTASLQALARLSSAGVDPARASGQLAAGLQAGASDAAIADLAASAVSRASVGNGASSVAGSASGALGATSALGGVTGAVGGAVDLGLIP